MNITAPCRTSHFGSGQRALIPKSQTLIAQRSLGISSCTSIEVTILDDSVLNFTKNSRRALLCIWIWQHASHLINRITGLNTSVDRLS